MDPRRFDRLVTTLAGSATRRGLVRLLGILPLGVPLASHLAAAPEAGAESGDHGSSHRRHRRKAKHRHQTGDDKRNRKGQRKGQSRDQGKRKARQDRPRPTSCTPESVAQTCAGTCGSVTNTCGEPVDCGSCDCALRCAACFTCDAVTDPATPVCVADDTQVGDDCGAVGQVCQAGGSCACEFGSCPECTDCAGDGTCQPCTGCCDSGICVVNCPECTTCAGDGTCQPDAARRGLACGVAGNVCKANGTCAPNTPPSVLANSFSGDEGSTCIQINLVGSDEDGQPLSFKVKTLPSDGDLFTSDATDQPIALDTPIAADDATSTRATLCYAPDDMFHGSDSFTYTATDPFDAESVPATISITVNDINLSP